MNVPTPIENLPGFNSGTNSQTRIKSLVKIHNRRRSSTHRSSSFRSRYEKSTTE